MKRVKLMIGNREISRRYLGNNLVWSSEKVKLVKILEGCFVEFSTPYISIVPNDVRFTEVDKIKKVYFNDVEAVGLKNVEFIDYRYRVNFVNQSDKENLLDKLGWVFSSSEPGVTVRFEGE